MPLERAFAIFCLGLLSSCAAIKLEPDAQLVRIVTNEPQGCEYLGEVTGNQGNVFTGGFTTNANLETGARNDMRNQAHRMAADTVQVLTSLAGQSGSFGQGSGSVQQTNVKYTGIAYKCTSAP